MPKPTTPTTNIQWNAIQNNAKGNSLVSQLYAGKPKTQTPSVTAASSQVKSPTAPQTSTPYNFPGLGGSLPKSAPTLPPTKAPVAPPTPPAPQPTTPVKSTTQTNNDGSSTQTTYHAPETTPDPNSLNGIIGKEVNTAQGNEAVKQNANAITDKYAGLINPLIRETQGQIIGDKTTGTASVGEGNSQLAEAAGGAVIQGLTNQEQQELAGNAQGLTAQQQEASGLNAAGTLKTPGNQFTQVPFNQQLVGADGQPIGGAGGSGALQSAVVNAINLIKSGSGYSNAITAAKLGEFGPQGTTALLNALGPKFNSNTSDADATAIAQNINTSATAQTNANANVVNDLTKNIAGLSAARSSVANIANNLISQVANNKGLNPSNINLVNAAAQAIAANTSDPQYQNLLNQMTDVVNTYAQILTPGANTDQSKATAAGLVNKLAQGSTIQQVIQGLDAQAQAKIGGSQTTLQNIKTGANPNPATQLTGQTVQAPDGQQIVITD